MHQWSYISPDHRRLLDFSKRSFWVKHFGWTWGISGRCPLIQSYSMECRKSYNIPHDVIIKTHLNLINISAISRLTHLFSKKQIPRSRSTSRRGTFWCSSCRSAQSIHKTSIQLYISSRSFHNSYTHTLPRSGIHWHTHSSRDKYFTVDCMNSEIQTLHQHQNQLIQLNVFYPASVAHYHYKYQNTIKSYVL